VTAITLQLDDDMGKLLHDLADAQNRSETDILREALAAYVQSVRPMPKGMGGYRSGNGKVSEEARRVIRQAVKDGLWP